MSGRIGLLACVAIMLLTAGVAAGAERADLLVRPGGCAS